MLVYNEYEKIKNRCIQITDRFKILNKILLLENQIEKKDDVWFFFYLVFCLVIQIKNYNNIYETEL